MYSEPTPAIPVARFKHAPVVLSADPTGSRVDIDALAQRFTGLARMQLAPPPAADASG
jgi:hypothetical protein